MQIDFLFRKTPLTRKLFFMAADIFFVVLSVWLAFLLRFDGQIPEQYFPFVFRMAVLAVVFTIPVFYFSKLYSFSWSFVSAGELISLFMATTVSFAFLAVAIFMSKYFPNFENFPRSTIFISYVLVFMFSGGIRISKRIYFRIFKNSRSQGKQKTLIVGAGDAGEQILRSILNSAQNPCYPAGFIDDSQIKQGVSIHGVKVLGKIGDIPEIAREKNIKQLIVALPSASNKVIKRIIELGRQAGIWKIKISPPLSELIKGRVSFKNLKTVEADDLLGRKEVFLDPSEIEKFIKGKTVLITGAAGSIGSELARQTAKFDPMLLLLLDQDETGMFNISNELEDLSGLNARAFVTDIKDRKKLKSIFSEFKPQIVFHAAAYKHVPLMEENPDEAVKNNVFGTKVLVEESLNSGVENFVQISTDKAINPTSVMGATKRVCEMICQSAHAKNNGKFISVRFGNVLDSRGSVIPCFREQIKQGGPVQVTHPEMKRYFMLISEACLLVMQAGAMGKGGEVFVLDMGKPIKILDLAKDMIKLSGFEPDKDIAIVFTGKRPGEKLFEEILTAEEGVSATKNQKIFIANLAEVNALELERKLGQLENAVFEDSKEKFKEFLFSFIK